MCGIFGVVATNKTLSTGQAAFIRAATVVGQLRGDDGTGWITQAAGKKPRTFKKALCGNDFLDTRMGLKGIKSLMQSQVVIGHNRKTTSGGDNDSDCHPYSYDNLVGVHNGGIPLVSLNRLNTTGHVADVDSAKLYAGINAVENPIDALEKIHMGAYALAWLDLRNDTLCLARNGDRPLWVANSDDGLYFASEPGMLFWLMSRYGLDTKESMLMEIEVDNLYSISLDKPSVVKITSYKAKAPVYKATPAPRNSGRDNKNAWFNGSRSGGNKAVAMFKYVTGVEDLAKRFPALDFLCPLIRDNLEHIDAEYKDAKIKRVKGEATRLDMVVTLVEEREGNVNFPHVYGYIMDEYDCGIVIPISMNAVKNEGYDFKARYDRAESSGSHFTVRVHLTSIRVCADGVINICANPITVWSDENNLPKDSNSAASVTEVSEALRQRPSTLADTQIETMWDRLQKIAPKVIDGKVVH